MEMSFMDAVRGRRTYYAIGKEQVVDIDRIQNIINEAVKHVPSAFNSQSARVVVLFDEQHNRLWDIVKAELKKIVPADKFQATEEKINGAFRSGYGSILYFEDMNVVAGLQQQFPAYKENFPVWSNQSSGMLQFTIWTALEMEGLGVSLQHYNPVIDDAVKAEWDIPDNWKLIAQMPFGKPLSQPDQKDYLPTEERTKIYK
ncbi:hypothetical protein SRRS_15800 [Sporomusa rhizae]|uniref:nitroreductase family protein n=1 Tax=Sporomusa rhizae TaxID=357999 RepID=UPI00352A90E2